MNIKEITKLAELMESKGLTLVELTEDGKTVKMERQPGAVYSIPAVPEEKSAPQLPPITGANAADLNQSVDSATVVKSPMVGVFYASVSPESESFVQVGTKVKKGDVLCIIEAMKLMNEIICDVDGEVVEVCIGNGQVVEYGQALFRIK